MGNTSDWPDHLRAGAVRFARPTAHFDECRTFYGEHLGLPVLASWRGHDGYDGVVFGLPGSAVQLELTQHSDPRIPESDFRLSRFAEQDLLRSPYPYVGAGEMR